MLELNTAPGIHRVEDANVNWYLVEDDQGVTVVDAGGRRHGSRCVMRWRRSAARGTRSRHLCSLTPTSITSASRSGPAPDTHS